MSFEQLARHESENRFLACGFVECVYVSLNHRYCVRPCVGMDDFISFICCACGADVVCLCICMLSNTYAKHTLKNINTVYRSTMSTLCRADRSVRCSSVRKSIHRPPSVVRERQQAKQKNTAQQTINRSATERQRERKCAPYNNALEQENESNFPSANVVVERLYSRGGLRIQLFASICNSSLFAAISVFVWLFVSVLAVRLYMRSVDCMIFPGCLLCMCIRWLTAYSMLMMMSALI